MIHPKTALHEYQQRAIDFMFEHDRSLGLMPVGSGKTVCSLTALQELMTESVIKRPIIFAPLRVATNVWPQERFLWEHTQNTEMVLWGGEPSGWPDSLWRDSRITWGTRQYLESRAPKIIDVVKRREVEGRLEKARILERELNRKIRRTEPPPCIHVTSYENALWLTELYEPGNCPFDAFVFDELGKLKNPKSPRYKALRKFTKEARIVIGLNGTPAPEGLLDLFAQVNVVAGDAPFGKSFYAWRQKFFAPIDWQGYDWRPQIGAQERILKLVEPYAFKVDEADLAYQKTMTHTQITIDLPDKARAAYNDMEKQMAIELPQKEQDIVAMSAAAASMKLRQIASGFIYDDDHKPVVLHEEKAHALSDLLDELAHEPLLICYEFIEDLDAIRRVYKNVPYLGQGVSSAVASETITRWNKRELSVLALHPLSSGHGVNLQHGGSHICWWAPPWPLEHWLQANGRIDRQGQTRATYSHSLIARNTIDERVWSVLVQKDATQAEIVAAIRKV